jgi:TPP-dependent pyruvate/acetoin dehydrogenase alpha subunit
VDNARKRDPVATLATYLLEQGILDQQQLDEIRSQARRAINEATDIAEAARPPDPSTLYDHVYVL